MSFDRDGFLTSDLVHWTVKYRRDHLRWFELASQLNGLAQGLVRSMTIRSDDNAAFVGSLLFLRGLSSFQGVTLLSERGMTQEARTLARSCFETMFYLGALQSDPAFLDDIIGEDAAQRRKIANALIKLPEHQGLDAKRIDILKTFVQSIEESPTVKAKSIGIEVAAKKAGLEGIYDTYYRGLSNDSSHPTLVAMDRYTDKDAEGEVVGLKWSPDASDVGDTMGIGCTGAIYLVVFALKFLGLKAMPAELDDIWEAYVSLVKDSGAPAH